MGASSARRDKAVDSTRIHATPAPTTPPPLAALPICRRIQAGDNPRILAQRLITYLTPSDRKSIEAEVLKD